MKVARQLGIVILLLVSYLTPAMACMVSNVQMNAEERACCRAMKNQCEQMGMSASHGCCQKTPKSAQDNALVTKTVTDHSVAVAILWLSAAEWQNLNPVAVGFVERTDYSPPQSPPASISVLRI
jgi:type II secretory pathway component PulM